MPGRIFASPPKRGDVIVFKLPRDGETDYIKRLIGLPGDRIQMINNRLYINGQIVDRQPLPPYATSGRFGEPVQVPHYLETLPGGVKHEIIQLEGDNNPMPYTANTDVYVVPPDHYFFMGDNRDNSERLARAAGPRRRRLRAVREPDRPRRGDLLLGRRRAGVGSLAMAVDGALESHVPCRSLRLGRSVAAGAAAP